jgi:beta-ribofuranosylaminobenzene 5'-phosphate synthase
MNLEALQVSAPSRLHFGLLSWGPESRRQFGSVGLMIEDPGLVIEARPSDHHSAQGPLADRALRILQRLTVRLNEEGYQVSPLHLEIGCAPAEHVGLGVGTALNLSIARLVLESLREPEPATQRLAALTGRGIRSGIGLHGFSRGGLLVDGGRLADSPYPPMLSRIEFPRDWSILVVIPSTGAGLADTAELEAFDRLPGLPGRTIDRLCRLVLLELLPAAAERELLDFGRALEDLQREVGRGFHPVQGGLFADPQLESLAAVLSGLGLVGVGQSSWGPTLYGFLDQDAGREDEILRSLATRLGPGSLAFWTRASSSGAKLSHKQSSN